MGLDFFIERKRKGKPYESNTWEEVVYGRNCYKVREIILQNISTYDQDTCEAKLTIGTLNDLIGKLAEYISSRNLNNEYIFCDDNYIKALDFLSQLAKVVYDHYFDYENDYEYRLINSF